MRDHNGPLRLVLQLERVPCLPQRGGGGSGALMRGPISEAIIIVALGFFIGCIPAAVIHFTIDSKWPSSASYSPSKDLNWPLPGRP